MIYGYANNLGMIANPEGKSLLTIIYDKMMFSDCFRAITLRSSRNSYDSYDNTIILKNSFISGYSRPNCSTCYSDNTIYYCKNSHAVRLFVSTLIGK
jgi:hypothetical protein